MNMFARFSSLFLGVCLAGVYLVAGAQEQNFQTEGLVSMDFKTVSCTGFVDTPSRKCVPIVLRGYLARAADTHSLVVISHGSGGLDRPHSDYAKFLANSGFNGLVLDHFGPRGVTDISSDFNAGRNKGADAANMAVDTLMVLAVLKEQPEWRDAKFGYLGESLGASAALDATRPYLRKVATTAIGRFPPLLDAIVALYPGCFDRSTVEHFVAMPMLFVLAEKDDNTPAAACKQYSDWMNSRGGTTEWKVLPGEYHDFDAPFKSHVTSKAENPSKCSNLSDQGQFTLDANGQKFSQTPEGYAALHKACVGLAWPGVTGGNKGDPHTGYDVWLAFFEAHLR